MKLADAVSNVLRYLSETTGAVCEKCVSRVSIKCGVGRKQMETVVIVLKRSGRVREEKVGKHRVLILSRNGTNV